MLTCDGDAAMAVSVSLFATIGHDASLRLDEPLELAVQASLLSLEWSDSALPGIVTGRVVECERGGEVERTAGAGLRDRGTVGVGMTSRIGGL